MKETIITIKMPLKRVPSSKHLNPIFAWGGGSVQEFGGRRVNTTRHCILFRWSLFTLKRNEYHDRSDAERADEYLKKWSECEKELRGLRLLLMGDSTNAEVKKLIRESLGIDLDEGRIM